MSKFSKEQQLCIDERGKSLLVNANAGSGKTTVLIERIKQLLREGEDLKKMLICTFTEESASDLKKKVEEVLTLDKKRDLFQASIMTIHAFCSKVVRENFFMLDIDPKMQIASSGELFMLQQQVFNSIKQSYYKEKNRYFIELMELFSDEQKLMSLLDRIYRKEIDNEQLLEEIFSPDQIDKLIDYELRGYLKEAKDQYQLSLECCLEDLENQSKNFREKLLNLQQEDLECIENAFKLEPKFPRMPSIKTLDEPDIIELKKEHDKYRNRYKALAQKIYKFSSNREKIKETQKGKKPFIKFIYALADEFYSKSFENRKMNKVLSFDDLEILAYEVLKNDEVSQYYKEYYDHVFVDEYQDTSEIQDKIIERVIRDNNLFVVGDVKQSIYAFRGAEPKNFLRKKEVFSNADKNSKVLFLKDNYRSSKKIIDGVNELFNKIMTEEFGGINYTEENLALAQTSQKVGEKFNNKIEIITIKKGQRDEEKIRQEIRVIISKIKQELEKGIKLRDMAIIMPTISRKEKDISELLREHDIAHYIYKDQKLVDNLEVKLLIEIISSINNYTRDIGILAMMRLPVFNLTDDHIYKVLSYKRTPENRCLRSFYTIISSYLEEVRDEKVEKFFQKLNYLRALEKKLNIYEFLKKVYQDLELEKWILSLDDVEQRITNINTFFRVANKYRESSQVGLTNFIYYIKNVLSQDGASSTDSYVNKNEDILKVMSIHKSKGLTFNTVFLANMSSKFNEDNKSNSYLEDDFFYIDSVDIESNTKITSLLKEIVKNKGVFKAREEKLRQLYVAMTRPERQLYVVLTHDQEDREYDKKYHLANKMSQYILSALESIGNSENFNIVDMTDFKLETLNKNKVKYSKREVSELEKKSIESEFKNISDINREYVQKHSVTSLINKKSVEIRELELNKAQQRGVDFHKLMQWIDFEIVKENGFDAAISKLTSAKEIDNKIITWARNFYERFLKKYVQNGYNFIREKTFVYMDENTGSYLRGMIDLIIEKDGNAIILDYKTDVDDKEYSTYKKQLEYYISAYESITNKKVKEAYISYVRLNNERKTYEIQQ